MPEFFGEKTEQPTPRRLEEAAKKGQFPRSAELQTVAVLFGALLALMFTGQETWNQLIRAFDTLGHLHDAPVWKDLTFDGMQGYCISGALAVGKCVGPIVLGTM